jgi:hypothetical protein
MLTNPLASDGLIGLSMRITFCASTIGKENVIHHVTNIVTGEYGSELEEE